MGELPEGLNPVLEKAKRRLEHSEALNEKQVEYTVVMPILKALGWDPENMDEMCPEYAVESRRVDWAFLNDGQPCLFLEEKAPDQNLSSHQEQLLDYAFKQGIRLSVLTNGREWWFYLPLEEGPWAERKFLTIDLVNQKTDEVGLCLTQFLQKEFVYSVLAHKNAKERYDESRERQRIERELPGAMRHLFSEPSLQIVEFFQNQTQGVIGALAPENLVREALKTVFADRGRAIEAEGKPAHHRVVAVAQGRRRTGVPTSYARLVGLAINGEPLGVSKWNDVLVQTANWLIEKGYDLPVDQKPGSKMPLISRASRALTSQAKRLSNGLYIETKYSAPRMVERARWLLRQVGLAEDILEVEWEERAE